MLLWKEGEHLVHFTKITSLKIVAFFICSILAIPKQLVLFG